MLGITLPAFAKVNLRLDIIGRRADGFHELRTIFQTISLHDTLRLEWIRGGAIELEITGNAALASESPRTNLVYRALAAMRAELGIARGVRARLEKRIPAGRGLGGGSSDAAAALVGLLRLARRRIPLARLVEIASELGSDVPFFLFGGRAAALGRGEQLLPLPDGPARGVLVISPRSISVATRDAYSWLVLPRARKRAARSARGAVLRLTNPRVASRLIEFCALCWSPQEAPLSNDFERAVFKRHPLLGRIKRELLQRGAEDAALAGSGSAVFGVFRNPAQARRAAHWFPNEEVFVCSTVTRKQVRRSLGESVAV
ncbi:MAG: 4-(cytidine 5'-diphospho)-2-C-methyl-D-erythritol kinase [Candidatus Acidiferrales bacterium]